MHLTNAACMIRVLDKRFPGRVQTACTRLTLRCMPHSELVLVRVSADMAHYLQIYVAPPKMDSGKGPKPVPDHGSMCNVGDHDSRCFVETLAGCRTQGCLFVLPELSL